MILSVRQVFDDFHFSEEYGKLFAGKEYLATVLDLKERICLERWHECSNVNCVRLVYKGRSLGDEELLCKTLQIPKIGCAGEKEEQEPTSSVVLHMVVISNNNLDNNSIYSSMNATTTTSILLPTNISRLDEKSMAVARDWVKQQAPLQPLSSSAAATPFTSMSLQEKKIYETVSHDLNSLLSLQSPRNFSGVGMPVENNWSGSPVSGRVVLANGGVLYRRIIPGGRLENLQSAHGNAHAATGTNGAVNAGAGANGVGNAVPGAVAAPPAADGNADDPPIVWFQGNILLRLAVIAVLVWDYGSPLEYAIFGIVAFFFYLKETGILRKLMLRTDSLRQSPFISAIYNKFMLITNEGFPVPSTEGRLLDLFSLIYSFYASLFPFWDPRPVTPIPVRVQPPQELVQGAANNN